MEGFVKAKMHTKDGRIVEVMYETWNRQLYGIKDFNPTKKFLDNMKTGEKLIKAMRKWFLDSTDEELGSNYSSSENQLRMMDRDNMQLLEISSLLNWEERGYGSEITYDFETMKRSRNDTSWY